MLVVLSPAKSLDFCDINLEVNSSKPIFYSENQKLLANCQKLTKAEVKEIMGISERLSELNYQRFQNFNIAPSKPAFYAYNGDVYENIDRKNLSSEQLKFLQEHFVIISGFYGLLRPLDIIKPYRLEMTSNISIEGSDLYNFWSIKVTNYIKNYLTSKNYKHVINLSSVEYSKVIDRTMLPYKMIDIAFKEHRNNQIRTIALNAKKARGMMANFIIHNKVDNIEELKNFSANGYVFMPKISTEQQFVFVR